MFRPGVAPGVPTPGDAGPVLGAIHALDAPARWTADVLAQR
ncbi:MAG: hypothetical protein U0325_23260 [Polyangiales bacterium]